MNQTRYMLVKEENKLHTNTEYDHLTGYVERTYTREWTDTAGNRWRKIVTVINLGRPDRGAPVDPDAQLHADESAAFEGEVYYQAQEAGAVIAHRKAALDAVLVAHLQANGPTLATELAELVTWNDDTVRAHLRSSADTYVCYQERPSVFGLPGQKWVGTATTKPTVKLRIRELIETQGVLTSTQIARRLDMATSTTTTALRRFPDTFCMVGTAKAANGLPVFMWGLVGIHDAAQQGAA